MRRKRTKEEENKEEEEEEDSSSSSSVAVAKEGAKSNIKNGTAELASLTSEAALIKARIEAARRKNAAKVKELIHMTNILLM
jgi:hypothetical protein